jgi:PadR family transcriptional regulator, regulatory protein PadR
LQCIVPCAILLFVMNTPHDLENVKSQMRKGVLEFCILLIASKKQIYASEILQELTKAELLVVEGTLYPLLNRLKQDGLLEYTWAESKSGPPRKYYALTPSGKTVLTQLTRHWETLNDSVRTLLKKYE